VTHLVCSGVSTLVYCSAGLSRSPCVAAAALAQVRRCAVADALTLVHELRGADVSPELLFDVQAALADE
jgi:protein-tyrosine phosphatase